MPPHLNLRVKLHLCLARRKRTPLGNVSKEATKLSCQIQQLLTITMIISKQMCPIATGGALL
jgi:hypothetical protein